MPLAMAGRGECDSLIVRTDYSDDESWKAVRAALLAPQGSDGYEPSVHFVDDPAWAGAGVADVLAAVADDEYLSVVFVADRMTMDSDRHALLAVDTEDAAEIQGDREGPFSAFRVEPAGVFEIDADLRVANLEFADYAKTARDDSDGIYRSML